MTKIARRASPSKTAHQKGTELEQAIGAIEGAILRANPNLSEKSYDITFRKIIIVDGVKHEIDVWVEFDLGNGYKSIFIFESKNWGKTIGKDHILVFSAKIEAANAQSGYFVAKSVSQYAAAAARNDKRIKILRVADDFINSAVIDNFHSVYKDQSQSVADFQVVIKPTASQLVPASLQMDRAVLTLNGEVIDYGLFSNGLVSQVIEEHSNTVPSHTLADGTYTFDVVKEVVLAPDILLVDGFKVERINIKLTYPFRVIRPKIVSKFDIESRGRSHTYEPVSMGAFGASQLTIVESVTGDGANNAGLTFVLNVVRSD